MIPDDFNSLSEPLFDDEYSLIRMDFFGISNSVVYFLRKFQLGCCLKSYRMKSLIRLIEFLCEHRCIYLLCVTRSSFLAFPSLSFRVGGPPLDRR